MRTLFLVRHAKSSWDFPALDDRDRPLNKRGKRNAPQMGKLLRKKGEQPDLIISSPAKRAFSTAKKIALELGYPVKNININEKLYLADVESFYSVIRKTGKNVYKLMLVSHNYGITYFANYISGSNIDNIPTAGVVRIDLDIDSWKEAEEKKGELVYLEYPKKHKETE